MITLTPSGFYIKNNYIFETVEIILPKTTTKWSKVFADKNIDEYVALNYFKKMNFIKKKKQEKQPRIFQNEI